MVEQIVAEHSLVADEMEAEAVGSEIEHAEPGDLFADSVLYLIRQIEGCRWHPDMPHSIDHPIAILVSVAADDGPQLDPGQELEKPVARLRRHVSVVRRLVAGRILEQALVQQQQCRHAPGAGKLPSQACCSASSAVSVPASCALRPTTRQPSASNVQ